MTTNVIYFTTYIHLAPLEVGLGMTIGGIFSIVAGVPLGALADAHGPRRMLIVGLLVQASAVLGLVFVRGIGPYIVLVILVQLGDRLAYGGRSALLVRVFSGDLVASRGRLRAGDNVGISLGAAVGAASLGIGSKQACQFAIVLNALMFILSAIRAAGLPATEGQQEVKARKRAFAVVHRDQRFTLLSILNGLVCLHYGIFEVAMPLWIVRDTNAPHWMVGALFIVNTAFVILFQVRISRGASDARSGARLMLVSGCLIVASTVLFALAGQSKVWLTLLLLVLAVIVYVLGEMTQSASSWAVSYEFSPADRQGEYQSAFGAAANGGMRLAPLLAAGITIRLGVIGWVITGAVVFVPATVLALLVQHVFLPVSRDTEFDTVDAEVQGSIT